MYHKHSHCATAFTELRKPTVGTHLLVVQFFLRACHNLISLDVRQFNSSLVNLLSKQVCTVLTVYIPGKQLYTVLMMYTPGKQLCTILMVYIPGKQLCTTYLVNISALYL